MNDVYYPNETTVRTLVDYFISFAREKEATNIEVMTAIKIISIDLEKSGLDPKDFKVEMTSLYEA